MIKKLVWFNRPGVASTFTPKLGIVQEWITSVAEINIRIWVIKGTIIRLSTSNKRKFLFRDKGLIKESYSLLIKSLYSYLQYHWCPMVLIVIKGLLISSIKYKSRKEGKAIKIRVIAGIIVQITSIIWPSRSNRLLSLLKKRDNIIYLTNIVIINKINIVWSWKKINCSIKGDIPSFIIILSKELMF